MWDLAKTRSSLWNKRHSVMKYICNVIWFSTLHCLCSRGINNHHYRWTGNAGSERWARRVSVRGYESVIQGRSSRKATLDSVGLRRWQEKSPGWKVVKYNIRAKSYSLIYVSAARSGGEYTTGVNTPLPRAWWQDLAWVYHGTRIHIKYIHISPISKPGLQMCLFVTLWWLCPE